MLLDLGFAVALVLCMWLHRRGRFCRAWSIVLFINWLAFEVASYAMSGQARLLVGLWTDFTLALIALYGFTFRRAPWWVLALALTWFAQILTHFTFDDDIPTMGLWLNVLCGVQIALVATERPTKAGERWWAYESKSHGRVAAAQRHFTSSVGGPDCRDRALRRAVKRMEQGSCPPSP